MNLSKYVRVIKEPGVSSSCDSGVRVEFGGDDFLIDSHLMLMTKKEALALRKRFIKALEAMVLEVLVERGNAHKEALGEHNARLVGRWGKKR